MASADIDNPMYWDSILGIPMWITNPVPAPPEFADETAEESDGKHDASKKRARRERAACADCPRLTLGVHCKYHRRKQKNAKVASYSEKSYVENLMRLNPKMTLEEAFARARQLFCPNHPKRKTYCRGVCSACYKEYLRSR